MRLSAGISLFLLALGTEKGVGSLFTSTIHCGCFSVLSNCEKTPDPFFFDGQPADLDKQMMERPQEALAIARRANLSGQEEKRLYGLAAQVQEKHLDLLGLGQVAELAQVLEKKLEDLAASRRVRIAWLKQRGFGLSQEEVRQLLGPPQRIAGQVLYGRQIEQWMYDPPTSLWLNFTCIKGQVPHLQTVHSGQAEKS